MTFPAMIIIFLLITFIFDLGTAVLVAVFTGLAVWAGWLTVIPVGG